MLTDIDKANAEFWNELCGSGFAQALGINDHSLESLRKFDTAYLEFYPYLVSNIELNKLSGKKVLEVGLGHGTLGQKIAENGAEYTGLDIADGLVMMMNSRLQMLNLTGKVIKRSMLNCPLESNSLDYVISIGCFHHTGNVQRCIDETYRILKPGGTAFIMVYNALSYRQWLRWPIKTFKHFLQDFILYKSENLSGNEEQRKAYDTNTKNIAAPETVFLSTKQLRKLLKNFSQTKFRKENCDDIRISRYLSIPRWCGLKIIGHFCGLDIYIKAVK